MTEDQFWRLTQAKFYGMVKVFKNKIEREDYRSGIIQATMRGIMGDKKAHPYDAFPEHKSKIKKENTLANTIRILKQQKLKKAEGK